MELGKDAILQQRVEDFLKEADRANKAGDVDAIAALCAFPMAIVMGSTRLLLDDPQALATHHSKMQEAADSFGESIWYADIISVDPLTDELIDCKLNIHWVGEDGQHTQTIRQTLILTHEGEKLKFAAIINPIISGFWVRDTNGDADA